MARRERIQFPGATYHLMARGNAGGEVFYDDEDRSLFMQMLSEIALKLDWRVHCWCLMSNHYHILLTTKQVNLSVGMQWFNSSYSQRFNRRHKRQGHVFQGRYKALLVNGDAYAVQLYRYILKNPLEAGLCTDPFDYKWSSARASMAQRSQPWQDFNQLHQVCRAYPGSRSQQLSQFLSEEARAPVALQGFAYSNEDDLDNLHEKAEASIPMVRGSIASYIKEGEKRWQSMARAVMEGKHKPASVARYFDVYPSTVTRAVERSRGQKA